MSNNSQSTSLSNAPSAGSAPMASADFSTAAGTREALRFASALFRQGPDWVTFFRELLGVDGVVRRLFPNPTAMADFEKTEEYRRIQQMLNKLRETSAHPESSRERTRVITVRLPESLHELLRNEAYDRQTSINKLCISKLLQAIDDVDGESQE